MENQADATFTSPQGRHRETVKNYLGERIQSSTTTEYTYGEARTYENVRHDNIRASVRCPYCLQVYDDVWININDDLKDKKLKDIQSYSNMKMRDNKHGTFF